MKRKRIFLLLAAGLLLMSQNLLSQKYQQEPPKLESNVLEFLQENRVETQKKTLLTFPFSTPITNLLLNIKKQLK